MLPFRRVVLATAALLASSASASAACGSGLALMLSHYLDSDPAVNLAVRYPGSVLAPLYNVVLRKPQAGTPALPSLKFRFVALPALDGAFATTGPLEYENPLGESPFLLLRQEDRLHALAQAKDGLVTLVGTAHYEILVRLWEDPLRVRRLEPGSVLLRDRAVARGGDYLDRLDEFVVLEAVP